MKKAERSESGQVFVILALVIVGLIGFTALAVDGGMVYAERRRAQNAVDAGALAAALAKTQSNNVHVAALNRTTSNGYDTSWGPCDPAGVDCTLGTGSNWTVEVTSPPRTGDFAGLNEYIRLVITTKVDTAFAHMVFKGGLQTTVEAVSRARPAQPILPGYALYGATKTECKGLWFSGTGNTVISGGSVFSNSAANSQSCQSGVQSGAGDITVGPSPENIQVVGNFEMGGSGTVYPLPVMEGVPQDSIRAVPLPDCTGLTDWGNMLVNAGQSVTLQPGMYESISFKAGASVTLNPGMYCIYGFKGFSGTGGSITGTGIMIYMQDGGFDLGGNSLVALAAEASPGVLMDAAGNDWMGMLVYFDPSNSNAVKLTGTTGTTYTGTIYAASADCTINGTGDDIGLLSTQIMCNTIKITGTAEVDIAYDQSKVYSLPPAIDLAR
ncbi:MAG: Tad domain-containing protein [Chloroflexi bacterium]|nr:Tad domain-containing protein [Chloroflexota bacterium]